MTNFQQAQNKLNSIFINLQKNSNFEPCASSDLYNFQHMGIDNGNLAGMLANMDLPTFENGEFVADQSILKYIYTPDAVKELRQYLSDYSPEDLKSHFENLQEVNGLWDTNFTNEEILAMCGGN